MFLRYISGSITGFTRPHFLPFPLASQQTNTHHSVSGIRSLFFTLFHSHDAKWIFCSLSPAGPLNLRLRSLRVWASPKSDSYSKVCWMFQEPHSNGRVERHLSWVVHSSWSSLLPARPGSHPLHVAPSSCMSPLICLAVCLPPYRRALISVRCWRCLSSFPQLKKRFQIEVVTAENCIRISTDFLRKF